MLDFPRKGITSQQTIWIDVVNFVFSELRVVVKCCTKNVCILDLEFFR